MSALKLDFDRRLIKIVWRLTLLKLGGNLITDSKATILEDLYGYIPLSIGDAARHFPFFPIERRTTT